MIISTKSRGYRARYCRHINSLFHHQFASSLPAPQWSDIFNLFLGASCARSSRPSPPLAAWGGSPGCTQLHRTAPYCTALNCTIPYCTALHHTAPHHTAPHWTAPYRTAPHRTAPHHTVTHHTAPHRTAPHHTAPHRTLPHAKQHYTVLLCCFCRQRR